jgi:hypothetical protein
MSALALQLVPAVSAAVAVCSFLAYLHYARRSEAHAARDEAMALASTRAEVIADLRRQLAAERDEAAREADCMRRIYEAAVSSLLLDLRADLSSEPPEIDGALGRIRHLLEDQAVTGPGPGQAPGVA